MSKPFIVLPEHLNPHRGLAAFWSAQLAIVGAQEVAPRRTNVRALQIFFFKSAPEGTRVRISAAATTDDTVDVLLADEDSGDDAFAKATVAFGPVLTSASALAKSPPVQGVLDSPEWAPVKGSWSFHDRSFVSVNSAAEDVRPMIAAAGCCLEQLPLMDQSVLEKNGGSSQIEYKYVGTSITVAFWNWGFWPQQSLVECYFSPPERPQGPVLSTSLDYTFALAYVVNTGSLTYVAARTRISFRRVAKIDGVLRGVNVFGEVPKR